MGLYSNLAVGKFRFQWKYYLPPTVVFLFDESDSFIEKEYDEEWVNFAGFKTTVGEALNRMESLGYTESFFVELYNDFYEELNEEVFAHLEYIYEESGNKKEVQKKVREHISQFSNTAPAEDINLYIQLFSQSLYRKDKRYNAKIEFYNGDELSLPPIKIVRYSSSWYLEEKLQCYLSNHGKKIPPGIFRVMSLFSEERFREYSDILLLFDIYLTLRSTPENKEVILDYFQLVETETPEKAIRNFHENMTNRLIHKVNSYNSAFKILLEKDSWLNQKYFQQKISNLWVRVNEEEDSNKKGELLESFTIELLKRVNGLKIKNKRVNNGDEEIDIIVSNHIQDAFWISLNSSYFLIECKNWTDNVGVDELKKFESTLRNHRNLCRVGFFVSVNGFSNKNSDYLKRIGREEQIIVLITGEDIEELIENKLEIKEWLENIIARTLA